jgi:hypothetical protein
VNVGSFWIDLIQSYDYLLLSLFYEQYPLISISFSHFFAHYESPHNPRFTLRHVLKIKLELNGNFVLQQLKYGTKMVHS